MNHAPPQIDAPPLFAKEEGWHWAERAFAGLFTFCPDLSELARQRVVPRGLWASIARWLAPLERFVRRLLLLEVLALPAPGGGRLALMEPKGALKVANSDTQSDRGGGQAPDSDRGPLAGGDAWVEEHPDAWRVSFRLPAGRQRASFIRRRMNSIAIAAPHWPSSLALAARIEALGRVFAAPGVYARRLARRLAHAGAALAARLIGAPRPPVRDDPIGADLDRDSYEACRRAAARYLDSS